MSLDSSLRRLAPLALAALAVAGCAEERPPINRVQPNALQKAFFVGGNLADPADDPEFYAAATIIDTPYGVNHGLFSGQAGGLKRLKWEILEDQLVARATYETYDGVDGHGSRRTNDGQVIAAFPIVSHFDVQREYNPTTGEELNIVGENTSDRPWYEREFVRVDWSRNLVTSSIWWDPLAQNTVFEGGSYGVEPLAYYVNDPASPDAPRFAGSEGYFDITQKVLVTPRTLTIDGQTAPTCLWRGAVVRSGASETGVCESSEIKVRMSFQRVKTPFDPGYREYEPKHWDGARMDAFGIFTQDRKGYDNHYGVVDDKWYRFAQRYNIWKSSFVRDAAGTLVRCGATGPYDPALDPNRDLVGNDGQPGPDGTDDECQGAPAGSRCNTIVGACTLPYARREVGTVAWHHHMSNDDPVIVEQSKLATEEWDTALRVAVQAARQAECRATSGRSLAATRFQAAFDATLPPAEACAVVFPIDQQEEAELKNVRAMNRCWDLNGRGSPACSGAGVANVEPAVAFCHNPVRGPVRDANGNQIYAGDDPSCGPAGLVTRAGDIRYHSINIWPTPENSSPWGFGPSWADPLTGEIIQSSINVYGAVTDERAQRIVDRVRWFKGELGTPDVLSAQYVRDRPRTDGANLSEAVSQFLQPRADVDRRLLGLNKMQPEALANAGQLRAALEPLAGARALRADLERSLMPPALGGKNAATFQARIDAVRGTPLEAQLVGPMWFDAASVDPRNASPSDLDIASPLGPENARKRIALEEAVQRRLAQNGACLYEADAPEPSSMPALGSLFDRKFPLEPDASPADKSKRVEAMWNYTRAKMHYGVLLHEMGHTIGLRHNFTSSFDKFNYRPQYWQLRTGDSSQGGRITQLCEDETTDPTGAGCIGPRYYDPLTQDEVDNSIYTWAQTTVMDYSGELTHDWLGLGVYDYAAARMFYGDVVDVREDLACPSGGCAQGTVAFSASDLVDFPGYLIPQTVDTGTGANFRVMHYSEWNDYFSLVDLNSCRAASEEELTPPPDWDESRYGIWDPVFDGEIVHNEVCARPRVAYYSWAELEPDAATDLRYRSDPQYYAPRRARTVPDVNGQSFVRMPYSFASDEFRDGWSPSILTRDAGADQYEQVQFFINQYENGHIWSNFRNGRTGFSIVTSYLNEIERYHAKLGNFVQGLSLLHDYYSSEIARNGRFTHAEVLAAYEGKGGFMREQAVAAGLVFDHFVRVLTRPQAGLHYTMPWSNGMFLAAQDRIGANPGNFAVQLTIPNGTTLLGQDLTFGGRPLDNGFEYGQGYWYFDYINQAGDFYEKAYAFDLMLDATYRAPYAFTRWDGIDGRWQFTNFANLFPDGMRRLIGAILTEDTDLYAPRITGTNGRPDLLPPDDSGQRLPANPLGWASYVPADGPEHCFPSGGNYLCRDSLSEPILTGTTPDTVAVEPQLGFEIQKFLAFWAYVYMPDSQVLDFVDMMRIWKLGEDIDPQIASDYVSYVDAETNIRYFARRQGDETLFGKTYDKGIAAKMLQWANTLAAKAYEVDSVDPDTGAVIVKRDADGNVLVADDGVSLESTPPGEPRLCDDNRYCVQLRNYRGLIDFMRDMGHQVGFYEPELSTVER